MQTEIIVTIVALTLAVVLGGWLTLALRRWADRRSRQRRQKRAVRGEDRARTWLEANGFAILGEQAALSCAMQIDGEAHEYEVCADFVVERNGERGIVEVKTGSVAQPASPGTRRQMFEYAALYGAQRVYMFDGDGATMHEVRFGSVRSPAAFGPRLVEWQIGFLAGVGASALVWVSVWLFQRA
jgi:Holliday junction resolvase-like predicted endonuclease